MISVQARIAYFRTMMIIEALQISIEDLNLKRIWNQESKPRETEEARKDYAAAVAVVFVLVLFVVVLFFYQNEANEHIYIDYSFVL